MTGENEVFSCTRSISLATCRRPFWMTARVTGSRAIQSNLPLGRRSADVDDEIAQPVDVGGRARIDQDRGVELRDDRRTGDRGADRQPVAAVDRRVEPLPAK